MDKSILPAGFDFEAGFYEVLAAYQQINKVTTQDLMNAERVKQLDPSTDNKWDYAIRKHAQFCVGLMANLINEKLNARILKTQTDEHGA